MVWKLLIYLETIAFESPCAKHLSQNLETVSLLLSETYSEVLNVSLLRFNSRSLSCISSDIFGIVLNPPYKPRIREPKKESIVRERGFEPRNLCRTAPSTLRL